MQLNRLSLALVLCGTSSAFLGTGTVLTINLWKWHYSCWDIDERHKKYIPVSGRKKKYTKHFKSKIDRPNIWSKINCFPEVITFPSALFEIFSTVQYFLLWDKMLMWEDQIFKPGERHCSSDEFQRPLPDTGYVIDNIGYSLKYMFTVSSFQKQYVP